MVALAAGMVAVAAAMVAVAVAMVVLAAGVDMCIHGFKHMLLLLHGSKNIIIDIWGCGKSSRCLACTHTRALP